MDEMVKSMRKRKDETVVSLKLSAYRAEQQQAKAISDRYEAAQKTATALAFSPLAADVRAAGRRHGEDEPGRPLHQEPEEGHHHWRSRGRDSGRAEVSQLNAAAANSLTALLLESPCASLERGLFLASFQHGNLISKSAFA